MLWTAWGWVWFRHVISVTWHFLEILAAKTLRPSRGDHVITWKFGQVEHNTRLLDANHTTYYIQLPLPDFLLLDKVHVWCWVALGKAHSESGNVVQVVAWLRKSPTNDKAVLNTQWGTSMAAISWGLKCWCRNFPGSTVQAWSNVEWRLLYTH